MAISRRQMIGLRQNQLQSAHRGGRSLSPLLYFPFEAGAGNSSSNAGRTPRIVATMGAGASWNSDAAVGDFSFTAGGGANAGFVVPDHPSFKFSATDSFSIAFWVKYATLPSAWEGLTQMGEDGGDRTAVFVNPSNKINFVGDTGSFTGDTALTVATWQHVAVVQDVAAGTRTIYLDGEVDGSQATLRGGDGAGDLYIGTRRADGTEAGSASIDGYRIYDYALTPAQVTALQPPAGPAPAVSINMVETDGAYVAQMDGQPTGLSGDDLLEEFTCSVWVNIVASNNVTRNIFTGQRFTAERDQMSVSTSEQLTMLMQTWLGAGLTNFSSTASDVPEGEDVHLMWTMSQIVDTASVWVNGVMVAEDVALTTTATPAGDHSDWHALNRDGSQLMPAGEKVGDLWVSNEYVASPVGVFIDALGAPLEGNADGSGYTGTQPILYMGGDAAAWNAGTNTGDSQDLTVSAGTMSDVV